MTERLTDRFGRKHTYLRISVTDRCNLRCTYCMPAEGSDWKPREEILAYEEIIRLARIFAANGVSKIRLTGGEPTIRSDIDRLIGGLAGIEGIRSLLMTTNGVTLKDKAELYKSKGLTGLNISLDTLEPEKFERITRRNHFHEVMAGIESAMAVGFDPLKINVVLMAGVNEDEILNFVTLAKDRPINIRFIEFMPFKLNGWEDNRLVSYGEMKARIQEQYELIPILREPTAVAKDFAIRGFQGTVSFITSMTESFCSTCNRVRLTADGSIKSCLFFPKEINVRGMLRSGASDEELLETIHEAILLKPAAHGESQELVNSGNRSMIQIGG